MDERLYEELAARLRGRRAELGLSQQNVAIQAGLTRSALANIETGRQSVLVHQLYRLARALECRPENLLPEPGPSLAPDDRATPKRVALFVASLQGSSAKKRPAGR